MAAGPDPGDDVVEPVREVGGDLLGGGPLVSLDVGRIVELHRDPGLRDLLLQLVGARDGTLHPQLAGRQLELCPVRLHEAAALDGERLGHAEDEPVPLDRGDQGEADAGVARGGLDEHRARPDDARLLRVLDHAEGDAILDAAARIDPLLFGPDGDPGVEEPVDPHVRCLADGLENAVVRHGEDSFYQIE